MPLELRACLQCPAKQHLHLQTTTADQILRWLVEVGRPRHLLQSQSCRDRAQEGKGDAKTGGFFEGVPIVCTYSYLLYRKDMFHTSERHWTTDPRC